MEALGTTAGVRTQQGTADPLNKAFAISLSALSMCPLQAAAIRHRPGQDRLSPPSVTNTARGRNGCISPLSLCVTGNVEPTLARNLPAHKF